MTQNSLLHLAKGAFGGSDKRKLDVIPAEMRASFREFHAWKKLPRVYLPEATFPWKSFDVELLITEQFRSSSDEITLLSHTRFFRIELLILGSVCREVGKIV